MSGLSEGFRRQVQHDVTHQTPFWIEAVPVHTLLESVHQETSSEDASELSHGHETLLLSELWVKILAEQQHEDTLQKVHRQQSERGERPPDREHSDRVVQNRSNEDDLEDTNGRSHATEFGSRVEYLNADFEKHRARGKRDVVTRTRPRIFKYVFLLLRLRD